MKKIIFLLMATTIFAIPFKNEKNFKPKAIKNGIKVEVVSYKEKVDTSDIRYRIYNSSGGIIEELNLEIIFIGNTGKRLTSYVTVIIDNRNKMGTGRERYYPSRSSYETYSRIEVKDIEKIKLKINKLSILR